MACMVCFIHKISRFVFCSQPHALLKYDFCIGKGSVPGRKKLFRWATVKLVIVRRTTSKCFFGLHLPLPIRLSLAANLKQHWLPGCAMPDHAYRTAVEYGKESRPTLEGHFVFCQTPQLPEAVS